MDIMELRQQLLNRADGPLKAAMYDTLSSKFDTLSQTDLLDELEKLAVVQVVAVVKDVNYSTLISEEKPFKPATSDVTRSTKKAAKRARQRSAKYETAAVVEVGNGDKLRDNRRKKQHHRIDLGGTSAHDHDHNGQFGEHRKPAMMKNRQLQGKPNTDEVFADNLSEFENSAMVEIGRDEETQVVSEFMTAHKKQEQKPDQQEENLKEIPNVDEEPLTDVDEAKVDPETKPILLSQVHQVHHELSEVSMLKLENPRNM